MPDGGYVVWTGLPTTGWPRAAHVFFCAIAALGCGESAAEPGFQSQLDDPDPREVTATEVHDPPPDAWYTLVLPPNAALGTHDQEDVIDAVYVVPPLTLTVLVPIPRQRELGPWASTVRGLFVDEPVLGEEDGSVGSVPAIIQQTATSLRWVFVADGVGVIVKCFCQAPRERAFLHEHCDPLLGEMSLVRPIRAPTPAPR